MENRIKKKITAYINAFKDDIIHEIVEHLGAKESHDLVSYITSYAHLHLEVDDFSKRKRVKNHVPEYDRCTAKRADGTQCTRRKKTEHDYCGTHIKGRPHGVLSGDGRRRIELTVNTVRGINHYMSDDGKIYPAESVLVK